MRHNGLQMFNLYLVNAKESITISLSPATWFLGLWLCWPRPHTSRGISDTQTEIWLPDGVTRSFPAYLLKSVPTHVNVRDKGADGRSVLSGRADKKLNYAWI